MKADNNAKGFTLLEILLAFFIFSVVMGIIYTPFITIQRYLNITEPQADIYGKARVAMGRVVEDLESACFSPILSVSTDEKIPFEGRDEQLDGKDADMMSFFSTSHLEFTLQGQYSDLALISYTVEKKSETDDTLMILRSDKALFIKEEGEVVEEAYVLCDGLRSVNFIYYDVEGNEYDTWDMRVEETHNRLPRMVDIIFEFETGPEAEPIRFKTSVALPLAGES